MQRTTKAKTPTPAKKEQNEKSSSDVDSTVVAQLFGLTRERVQQLAANKIISSTKVKGDYRFSLTKAAQEYIRYLQDIVKRRSKEPETAKLESDRLEAEVGLKKAKERMANLQVKELEGKMHRSEDVAEITADLIYTVRAAFLALPGRVAADVAAVNTAAEAANIIRLEVNRAMEGLANYDYDPAKYEERVRDRARWDSEKWDGEDTDD